MGTVAAPRCRVLRGEFRGAEFENEACANVTYLRREVLEGDRWIHVFHHEGRITVAETF
jgi:hypothetical protein